MLRIHHWPLLPPGNLIIHRRIREGIGFLYHLPRYGEAANRSVETIVAKYARRVVELAESHNRGGKNNKIRRIFVKSSGDPITRVVLANKFYESDEDPRSI